MQQIPSDVGSNMYSKDHQKHQLNIQIGNMDVDVLIRGKSMDIIRPTFSEVDRIEQTLQYNMLPTPASRSNAKKL